MKKRLLLYVVILLTISCNPNKKQAGNQGKQVVTVSIIPQKTFVEKIAGDDFDIQVLVPHGTSPESYSLLPSQLQKISTSSVWFRIGYLGFELSWWEKINQLNPKMEIIDLSEGLDLIVGKEIQHGDHVHFEGVDPHTWVSPKLVRQMAGQIAETLSELNPGKKEEYMANFQKFTEEISQLDTEIQNNLDKFKGRAIMTFHPSLAYFARDYGLIQYSLESDGKEPTSQHMAKMVDLARKENIRVIYIQSEFDLDHAQVFAREIGGKVIEIKPLDPDWQQTLRNISGLITEYF